MNLHTCAVMLAFKSNTQSGCLSIGTSKIPCFANPSLWYFHHGGQLHLNRSLHPQAGGSCSWLLVTSHFPQGPRLLRFLRHRLRECRDCLREGREWLKQLPEQQREVARQS